MLFYHSEDKKFEKWNYILKIGCSAKKKIIIIASFRFDELDGEARASYQKLEQFYICEIKSFVSIHIINETFTINEKASLVKVMSQSQKHKSHFDVNNTGKKMFGYMEKGRKPKSQLAFSEVKPCRSLIVIY